MRAVDGDDVAVAVDVLRRPLRARRGSRIRGRSLPRASTPPPSVTRAPALVNSTDHAGGGGAHQDVAGVQPARTAPPRARPPPVPCSAQVTRRCRAGLAVGGVVTGVGKHRSMTHMTAAVTYRSPRGRPRKSVGLPILSIAGRSGMGEHPCSLRLPHPDPFSPTAPVASQRAAELLVLQEDSVLRAASSPRSASRRPTSTAVRRINPLGSPSTTRMLSSWTG